MVTTGIMLQHALAAAELLSARRASVPASCICHTVKPLDTRRCCCDPRGVEAGRDGRGARADRRPWQRGAEGLLRQARGSACPPCCGSACPTRFTHNYGSQDGLLKKHGLDAEQASRPPCRTSSPVRPRFPRPIRRRSAFEGVMYKVRYSYLLAAVRRSRAEILRGAAPTRRDRRFHARQAGRRVRGAVRRS